MECIDIVLLLIQKAGITKNKMLTDLKLSKNSFVDWKKRGTIPSGETLQRIADYFNVSVDYLLGNEKEKPNVPNNDEVPEEIVLLARKMDKIDPEQRKRIYKLLDSTVDGVLEALDAEDRHPPHRGRR